MKKIRSYKKLVNEIINLQIPFRMEIIGYVNYDKDIYPMFVIKNNIKTANKTVVILSGHHGDEPFAVHTLIKWIKQFKQEEFENLNIFVYPVCNPSGYATGLRDNAVRQDTNNDANFVKDSKVQELAVLYDNFPINVDLLLDIHGDTGKSEVYMYEHKPDNLKTIAEEVLKENDNLIPYLKAKTIYKIKVSNGVIIPPKCDVGLEGVIEKLGIDYTMTLELPGKYDGQKRMVGGIAIINSILTKFKEVK
jgi:predicted deacylase